MENTTPKFYTWPGDKGYEVRLSLATGYSVVATTADAAWATRIASALNAQI